MSKNFRVFHSVRNYSLNFDQVEKAIREHGSFVWVEKGKTFRDATFEDVAAWRKAQPPQPLGIEVLVSHELPQTHFSGPANTLYSSAQPAYEEISDILAVRKCRWPRSNSEVHLVRAANQFAESAA